MIINSMFLSVETIRNALIDIQEFKEEVHRVLENPKISVHLLQEWGLGAST